ncbi:MAG: PEGA domain-containing protein [Myxococcaceae bacterium]
MNRLLLCAALLAASISRAELPRLAVTEVSAPSDLTPLADATSGVLASELQRLGVFQVTSAEQVRQMVGLQRQQALTGSGEGAPADLGAMLAVDYLASGKLSAVGTGKARSITLELLLLEAKSGKRESSDTITASSESELVSRLRPAVIKLAAPVLKGLSGTLMVSASEQGATVKIDDVVRGTTPLAGRLELPAGPHMVVVEKDGFVAGQREVRIQPGQLTDEQLTLVPSNDFIQAYETKASRMRLGAYVLAGVAGVGVGTAAYMNSRADALYGTPDKAGTFAFHKARLDDGIESEGGVNHRTEASALKSQVESAQTLTWVGAALGVAAAAGSAYLFISGEPPGRYERFTVIGASAALIPVPGGVAGSFAVTF